MKTNLLPWQSACLHAWEANNFRGIVNVVTGAGKTFLAIAAIERILEEFGDKLTVKIIVPKTFLMYQWHSGIQDELGFPRENIGFFSGTHKSQVNKQIMLYVINSARDVLARHVVFDASHGNNVLLIADECHHYGSAANAKIFGYTAHLPQNASIYTLGLSATPWCANYNEVLIPSLGKEIYNFGFLAALNAAIISKFALFNVAVPFAKIERDAYDELSNQISFALHKLTELCPALTHGRQSSHSFFVALENIIQDGESEAADLAKTVLILSMQRKEIVYKAKYRIDAVVELVRRIPKSSKIIIFGERIETTIEINRRLNNMYPNEVGVYHSKVPKPLGIHTLRQFEDGDIRILVSCKTLDEGLNVAKTDVGIVVSSTGSRRQRVQRLGRVLRKKSDNNNAYFYYLYVGETTEEDELLKEIIRPEFDRLINRINLTYNEESGVFENPQYTEWESSVVQDMQIQGCDPEEIIEFMKNADRLLLTEDWLMPEDKCRNKLASVFEKHRRNYYISALLLIRARKMRIVK